MGDAPAALFSPLEGTTVDFTPMREALEWRGEAAALPQGQVVFLAFGVIGREPCAGSCIIPWGQGENGSTVYLPFQADHLVRLWREGGGVRAVLLRREGYGWRVGEAPAVDDDVAGRWVCRVPLPEGVKQLRLVAYRKERGANDGWGRLLEPQPQEGDGFGDQWISHYAQWRAGEDRFTRQHRTGPERARVYQLFLRLFGNTTPDPMPWGSLAENGVGRFEDLDAKVLASLRGLGVTHLWLTGLLRQATGTEHPGLPADPPELLKGMAGSPYAIKDPFDLCPDYATHPEARWEEFQALVERVHAAGLRLVIDFVPNHLARSFDYRVAPEQEPGTRGRGGTGDDQRVFFHPENNFYYLSPAADGPPLRLPPVPEPLAARLGEARYEGEATFGRVTGNNQPSWAPSVNDWYETVKLNYGYDFTTGTAAYPNWENPGAPVPDTWWKMDAVLAHWQRLGVDGFRCDMAHLVPPEFWAWALARARARDVRAWFIAESYDDDPAGVPVRDPLLTSLPGGRSSLALLDAGFDAVYDDGVRKTLARVYDGPAWANDLALGDSFRNAGALRYAENHDEVRLAAPGGWGGVGREVGRAVASVLYLLGGGPILLYNGQEFGEGEPSATAVGHGGHDGRTSIFDYGTMPTVARWLRRLRGEAGVPGDPNADALRAFYGRLLALADEPAFREGRLDFLNPANGESAGFGRMPGELAGGHWMVAFVRSCPEGGQRFLVVVNLHPREAFRDVEVCLPAPVLARLGLEPGQRVRLLERLAPMHPLVLESPARQVRIGVIPPLTAFCLELTIAT